MAKRAFIVNVVFLWLVIVWNCIIGDPAPFAYLRQIVALEKGPKKGPPEAQNEQK